MCTFSFVLRHTLPLLQNSQSRILRDKAFLLYRAAFTLYDDIATFLSFQCSFTFCGCCRVFLYTHIHITKQPHQVVRLSGKLTRFLSTVSRHKPSTWKGTDDHHSSPPVFHQLQVLTDGFVVPVWEKMRVVLLGRIYYDPTFFTERVIILCSRNWRCSRLWVRWKKMSNGRLSSGGSTIKSQTCSLCRQIGAAYMTKVKSWSRFQVLASRLWKTENSFSFFYILKQVPVHVFTITLRRQHLTIMSTARVFYILRRNITSSNAKTQNRRHVSLKHQEFGSQRQTSIYDTLTLKTPPSEWRRSNRSVFGSWLLLKLCLGSCV